MEPIIKVDNVSMCFNLSTEKHESLKEYLLAMVQGRLQYDEFYALRDVSLDIMPGDFYGLVGLNGSGKSTLLKTIAGVYKPTKGKVTVNGTIAPLIELGAGFDMDQDRRRGMPPDNLDGHSDSAPERHDIRFNDIPTKDRERLRRNSHGGVHRDNARRAARAAAICLHERGGIHLRGSEHRSGSAKSRYTRISPQHACNGGIRAVHHGNIPGVRQSDRRNVR